MPIILKVDELEPGMKLAGNLMNEYSLLRPAGHVISEQDISAIKRIMPDADISIGNPLLDEKFEFDNTEEAARISRQIRHNVSTMVQKVSGPLRDGASLDAKSITGMKKAVTEMMEFIQANPVTTVLLEQSGKWDNYLQEHAANVFYLSMIIGNTIRNYIKNERERLTHAKQVHNSMNLASLGLAAMFHDIGLVSIFDLINKKEVLTPDEIQQVRQHPVQGVKMLADLADAMTRLVIQQHHENFDGSGYPEGLTGEKTAIFARIVRVADAYSAAIADKAYQRKKSPAMVIHEMVYGAYKRCYDPIILKVFANLVHPFPIGAKLLLVNGKWAVVLKQNPRNTFHPEVVLAFDELGDPVPPDKTKPALLNSTPELRIKSYNGQDMGFLNETLTETGIPEKADFSNLFDMFYP